MIVTGAVQLLVPFFKTRLHRGALPVGPPNVVPAKVSVNVPEVPDPVVRVQVNVPFSLVLPVVAVGVQGVVPVPVEANVGVIPVSVPV